MTEPKRVLVVDDEDYWRKRTCAMVTASGHVAITANGYREAKALLDSQHFNLLITDNSMETEDAGIALLYHEWCSDREIPSILLTSSELTRERLEKLGKELPHVTYVQKTVVSENVTLLETMKKLLA